MSTAIMIANLVDKLKAEQVAALAQLGELDRMVNELYHMFEYLPMNAVEMAQVTRKLKETLSARRDIKDVIAMNLAIMQGPLEKIKSIEEIERRAAARRATYAKEALVSYEKMFNKCFRQLK